MKSKKIVKSLLEEAGIKVGGDNSQDIEVHNEKFYGRVLSQGSLGLGESYMDGWWDCQALDEFFYRIFCCRLEYKVNKYQILPRVLKTVALNPGSKKSSFHIGKSHYDLGNGLYRNVLDKRLVYSCGYWKQADSLNEAQEAKLDLICRKLNLDKGMKILDIGCGWGSFLKYAAEKYGVKAVGITVSAEQVKLGRELCKGLPVEIKLQDYRQLKGRFDHIVSVGMFEHVGYKNYQTYMRVVRRLLKDNGLFLLQTISRNKSAVVTDPWVSKYIFPGGMLPSMKQIAAAVEGLFVVEDLHNFGADYDKTLLAWHQNFKSNWYGMKSNYGERFYRMWEYYLLSFAGSFRARAIQLWQIVFSKNGILGGYQSMR